MRTVAACAALAFVLASCSGGAGTMDGIMHSWEGAPLDAVIAQWGYGGECLANDQASKCTVLLLLFAATVGCTNTIRGSIGSL